jgi:DNA-binding transcriptional LysR family regulator
LRLPSVDLNLFVVFDAIYDQRNLTRAARVLYVTQPAVSNALKRLRRVFRDPLFVRTPHGVMPTPVADSISASVKEALNLLNLSLTEGQFFTPRTSEKIFRFSVHDYGEAILIPRLMEQLAGIAPGIRIECYPVERVSLENELASGGIDFAFDVPLFSTPQLCRQQLSEERYVCMVRRGHPVAGAPLTLERYLGLDHVHVSSRRQGVGHVDMALEMLGLKRNIALRMKNYLAAPRVVAATDLALTLPSILAASYDMERFEMPFVVETLNQFLYWHKSADQDQASIWMRNLLLGLVD